MLVSFLLYDDMTALDLVGPYECLAGLPGARVQLVASTPGPRRTDRGMQIVATHALADAGAPDILVIPGTSVIPAATRDPAVLAWVARVQPAAQWTCSVCTGALVLGAAGVLRGRRATTHWLALELLRTYGAEPVRERVVFDGPVVTCAGVSAGIDFGLDLAGRVASPDVARTIQLLLEYDPHPPYDAGTPERAGAAIVEAARRALAPA